MAKQSEGIILRKMGGRQNEVLLHMLKRAPLARYRLEKKQQPAVLIFNGIARQFAFAHRCTASNALKNLALLGKTIEPNSNFNQSEPTSSMHVQRRNKK